MIPRERRLTGDPCILQVRDGEAEDQARFPNLGVLDGKRVVRHEEPVYSIAMNFVALALNPEQAQRVAEARGQGWLCA